MPFFILFKLLHFLFWWVKFRLKFAFHVKWRWRTDFVLSLHPHQVFLRIQQLYQMPQRTWELLLHRIFKISFKSLIIQFAFLVLFQRFWIIFWSKLVQLCFQLFKAPNRMVSENLASVLFKPLFIELFLKCALVFLFVLLLFLFEAPKF